MVVVAVTECKPINGKKCKTSAEINEWLKQHPLYFLSQTTSFQSKMFEDSNLTKRWPHNLKPKEDYSPTEAGFQSVDFGTIDTSNDRVINVVEILYGYHDLTFKDSPWFWAQPRKHRYFDLVS